MLIVSVCKADEVRLFRLYLYAQLILLLRTSISHENKYYFRYLRVVLGLAKPFFCNGKKTLRILFPSRSGWPHSCCNRRFAQWDGPRLRPPAWRIPPKPRGLCLSQTQQVAQTRLFSGPVLPRVVHIDMSETSHLLLSICLGRLVCQWSPRFCQLVSIIGGGFFLSNPTYYTVTPNRPGQCKLQYILPRTWWLLCYKCSFFSTVFVPELRRAASFARSKQLAQGFPKKCGHVETRRAELHAHNHPRSDRPQYVTTFELLYCMLSVLYNCMIVVN